MTTDIGSYRSSEPVQAMPDPAPTDAGSSSHTAANEDNEALEASSDSGSERMSRADRPRLARRQSASILVPRDHPEIEISQEEFPPDDARAMSPRRNSEDVDKLFKARAEVIDKAKTLQTSLHALTDRIDEVESQNYRLVNENRFLQDYIGGLTRTMSTRSELTSTSGAGKGKKSQKGSKAPKAQK